MAGVAALALTIATGGIVRESILTKQRQRRQNFLPESVRPQLMDLVEKLGV